MKRLLTAFLAFSLLSCGTATAPRQISPADARDLLADDPDVILLDVRTASEYADGHIPGALLLPLDELADQAASALPDKDAPIIVYCRSGNRSAQAVALLDDLGYTDLYDLGGILDWPYDIATE